MKRKARFQFCRHCLLILFLLVAIGIFPSGVMAEDALVLEEMNLLAMPEYLTKDVVVNQIGVFVNTSDSVYQGRIEFDLPKEAEITDFSIMLEDFYSRYYEIVEEETINIARYDMLEPLPPGEKLVLMVEYKYPLTIIDGKREMEIVVSSKYPVEKLGVGIQKPFRTTDFALDPATDTMITDREGFDIYQYEFTDVEPNESMGFVFSYQKADDLPSIEPQPMPEVHPVGQKEEEKLSNTTVMIIIFAFILAMVLGFFLLNRSKVEKPANQKRKR